MVARLVNLVLALTLALSIPQACWGAEAAPAGDEPQGVREAGQDPTRPLSRLDLRVKYQKVASNFEAVITTLRYDKPIPRGNGRQIALRLDVPFVYTDLPGPGGANGAHADAGDTLIQVLFIRPGKKRDAIAIGGQIVLPTASKDQMGTGKYLVNPAIGRVVYPERWPPGSFYAVFIGNYISVAGDSQRRDIN